MDKEQAKSILRNVVNPDVKEAIETLIPEFNESEDERNWKAVLDCVKDETLRGWLEKKKEQKHLSKFDVDAAFDAREPRDNWEYIKEFCDKFGRMPKDMDELDELVSYVMVKKQKEQKPIISAEESLGISREEYSKIVDECIYGEDKEQKTAEWDELQSEFRNINEAFEDGKKEVVAHPEKYGLCKKAGWNEKDEHILENIYAFVKENTINPNRVKCAEECLDWLKLLLGRLNPQLKQEWSVKDELAFTNSIETLEYLGKFELADWLKEHKNQFLKPQNTWKPSEEQMCYLLAVINEPNNAGSESCHIILKSLYRDLKKLK